MEQRIFDWFVGNFNLPLLDSEWHDIQRFVNSELQSKLTASEARVKELEGLLDHELKERDLYHDKADELANAISQYFNKNIGEHSNSNCPWDNAIQILITTPPEGQEE